MIIGVPGEQKEEEYRVAILPQGVQKLTESGHKMLLEQGAGKGTGIEDDVYKNKGAEIVSEHGKVFEKAELILKVKESKESEYNLLQEGQLMFSYFHFEERKAASPRNEVEVVCLSHGPASIESAYDEALAAPYIIEEVKKAEKEGYSAVSLDCAMDTIVRAAPRVQLVFRGKI